MFLALIFVVSVTGLEAGIILQHQPFGIGVYPQAVTTRLLPLQTHSISTYTEEKVPERTVSYSLSYEDYHKLKQHKSEGGSPFDPDSSDLQPREHLNNPHKHHDHNKHGSGHGIQDAPVLKRSVGNNPLIEFTDPSLVSIPVQPIQPLVHKHVYFHVPPPEFEEPPVVPRVIPSPKKHYKILFIKVPSQEPKNFAYLQQLVQNSQAAVEDKTLIYVLTKKQDPLPPAVQPPKPSSAPQVFFLNYKVDPTGISAINNELSLPSILQNVSPLQGSLGTVSHENSIFDLPT